MVVLGEAGGGADVRTGGVMAGRLAAVVAVYGEGLEDECCECTQQARATQSLRGLVGVVVVCCV